MIGKCCLVVAGIVLSLLFAAAPAGANLIVNGGFETPALAPGAFQTIVPGGEPAGFVWSVTSGDIDQAYLPVNPFVDYPAYEGNQAVDMNGTVRGALSQVFATSPGSTYSISLAYADNPLEGGVSSADILLTDVGTTTGLLSSSIFHSTSTNSPANADWQVFSALFTAIGPLTKLSIASTSPSDSASGGIILDAVSVDASVPEPAAGVLCLSAALALGLAARGKRVKR
jgi:hypothetical protein